MLAFQLRATVNDCAVAEKFIPVTFAELTVAFWLAGVNVYPALAGVMVYAPFANPAKV